MTNTQKKYISLALGIASSGAGIINIANSLIMYADHLRKTPQELINKQPNDEITKADKLRIILKNCKDITELIALGGVGVAGIELGKIATLTYLTTPNEKKPKEPKTTVENN